MRLELSSDDWASASPDEKDRAARRLLGDLPRGFESLGVATHHLGGQELTVAFFGLDEARFALIPGGEVTVGYEGPFEPTAAELEDWEIAAEEYGVETSMPNYVDGATRSLGTVEIHPFLIETRARELGWETLRADHPDVRATFGRRPKLVSRVVQIFAGERSIRGRRTDDGGMVFERAAGPTHAELSAEIARDGFRFPTSDEWEYACGAGARSLFRWGDRFPTDSYPVDEPEDGEWNLHRRPNAFGLEIAVDPYRFELVAEPDRVRGGDGGAAICGGAGAFLGWLPLATAWFEDDACLRDPEAPVTAGFTFGRRVLSLG